MAHSDQSGDALSWITQITGKEPNYAEVTSGIQLITISEENEEEMEGRKKLFRALDGLNGVPTLWGMDDVTLLKKVETYLSRFNLTEKEKETARTFREKVKNALARREKIFRVLDYLNGQPDLPPPEMVEQLLEKLEILPSLFSRSLTEKEKETVRTFKEKFINGRLSVQEPN